MSQQRQSGVERYGIRNHDFHSSASAPDHISVGIRIPQKQGLRNRRFGGRYDKNNWKITVWSIVVILSLIVFFSVFAYYYLSRDKEEFNRRFEEEDEGQTIFADRNQGIVQVYKNYCVCLQDRERTSMGNRVRTTATVNAANASIALRELAELLISKKFQKHPSRG